MYAARPMNKMLLVLLVLSSILAGLVSGCGSSSDGETTDSLTKADFVKQANAICLQSEDEIEALLLKFRKEHLPENKLPSKNQLTEVAEDILLPSLSKEVEEIRALDLPGEGTKDADAALAAFEEAIRTGENEPVAIGSRAVVVFRQANGLARELGMTKCLVN